MIFSLLQVYGMIPNTYTMGAVATFFQSLAPLNSVANPVIYAVFNTRTCRNAKKINSVDHMVSQVCCCRCNRRTNSTFGVSVGSEYTGVSEMDMSGRTSTNAMGPRRISGLPYVRNTVTETERQILMRNLTPKSNLESQEKNQQSQIV